MSFYFILFGALIILPIDIYYYRSLKSSVKRFQPTIRKTIKVSYWAFTLATLFFMLFVASYFNANEVPPKFARVYLFGIILIILLSKLIACVFLIIHDIIKLVSWINKKSTPTQISKNNPISRIEFLKKTALIASIIPFSTLMFGVLKSAFDYTIHHQKLRIANLPNAFKGLKIVQ